MRYFIILYNDWSTIPPTLQSETVQTVGYPNRSDFEYKISNSKKDWSDTRILMCQEISERDFFDFTKTEKFAPFIPSAMSNEWLKRLEPKPETDNGSTSEEIKQ